MTGTVMVKVNRDGVIKHEAFRTMSPEEARERQRLNDANTAAAIRRRARTALWERNGQ